MEVEQRINLSLDDIIRQRGTASAPHGTSARKPKGRGRGAAKAGATKPKGLGVRNGVAVKKGGKKVKVQTPSKAKKGGQRRTNATGPAPSRRKPADSEPAGTHRVVAAAPAIRTVTVTITNERALQQHQRQLSRAHPSMVGYQQPGRWGARAARRPPPPMLTPPSGYGPRNRRPIGDPAAVVTSSRLALSSMRQGGNSDLGQQAGRGGVPPLRRPIPFVDYDNTSTGMRMDYNR